MRNTVVLGLAGAAGIAALAIGFAAAPSHRPHPPGNFEVTRSVSASSKAHPSAAGDTRVEKPVIRLASNPTPLPPFLVNDLNGGVVSTAGFGGKVVLLNFWATWCPPCREEIPELIELANRYKDQLEIVGVSMDDASPQEVREFAEDAGINYPVVMGSRTIASEYGGVPALPTSFIVNREGRVVQKHVGVFPIDVYDSEIRALLGLPVNATIETFQDTGQIFLKNAALATELPGVSFAGLTADQKRAALKRMNSETCTCGCGLTIAQCRINDTNCQTSKQLAANIVQEIHTGHPAAPATPTHAAAR